MMATLEIFINERGPYLGTLNIETEQIDITMGRDTYKLDPKWTFVDKAGHFHAVTGDGKLPTLEPYTKTSPCGGECGDSGCDGVSEQRYRCRLCRKRVKPGRVIDQVGGVPRTMPGRTSWWATVKTKTEWKADVSIRAAAGRREMFGLATPHLAVTASAGGELVHTYEFHGITELGRRP